MVVSINQWKQWEMKFFYILHKFQDGRTTMSAILENFLAILLVTEGRDFVPEE